MGRHLVRPPPPSVLRLFVVIPGPAEGASMVFAKRQAAALKRVGHAVEVFHLSSRTHVVKVWGEWRRMRAAIRAFAPDVVLAMYGTLTAFLTGLATRRPLVVTFRGSDLNPSRSVSWVRSALGRLLSQLSVLRAVEVICVSPELRQRLWWRRSDATVIPTGVDRTVFYPIPRAEARRVLQWDDRPVVLFYAGKDPRGKRLDLAEAAFAEVRRTQPAAVLEVLWGDVPPDQIPFYLNAADCLLVTSEHEGSPTIVTEALACDLPVVSVPVGDVAGQLDGVDESVVVPRDPMALAAAVRGVCRHRRRANAQTAANACDAELLLGQTVAVLRRAAGAL